MKSTHVSVRLDPQLYGKLSRAIELSGRKSSELLRRALEKECDEILKGQTAADRLEKYIGRLASERPGNSGRIREVMTEILEERRKSGRL